MFRGAPFLICVRILKTSNILEGLNQTISLSNIDRESFTKESHLKVIRKVIVDKLNESPNRAIIFENKLENKNPMIEMDSNLFYRMIENILKNSLIYTAGQITVTISDAEDEIIITISDEGEGVPENILEKINN